MSVTCSYDAFTGKQNLKDPEIFPQDKIYKVGSRVVFCCILPAGEIFYKMYLTGYNDSNMHINKISNQTFTLSVHLNQASSSSGIDVICETSKPDTGASIYIGYPPRDSDLQCETQNLQSLECHWTVGNTHLSHKSPTVYHLLGRYCIKSTNSLLFFFIVLVHMIVPKGLKTSIVHARNVTLNWRWTVQQYNNLNISCQVKNKNFGVGLRFAVLFNLMPNCTYNVTVQCGTAQNFWKWSDWSTSLTFQTKSDGNKLNSDITSLQTRLANQSHERSEDYEVTWVKTTEKEQENRTKVGKSLHSLAMRLDATTEYIVTVTARNINGSSPPSAIIIPSHSSGMMLQNCTNYLFFPQLSTLVYPYVTSFTESSSREERVNTSRIIGSRGGFNLSWSASPLASCGYVVDWCPILGDYNVEWLKVPTNETNVTIFPMRYLISIYACTQGAPVILERREGYASEKGKIEFFNFIVWNQQGSDVEVSWDPINPREQPAFIQGYVLYCLSINNNIIINVSTGIVTQIFSDDGPLIEIKVTLYTPSLLIFDLTFISNLLKLLKIYPPIPKPVLTDKWLTSPVGSHDHDFKGLSTNFMSLLVSHIMFSMMTSQYCHSTTELETLNSS
uniref:Fibronectin type-III domain-containing protein n=1 Tax=Mola mola TaxID=94237 RepID=A0A3Q3WEB9_MOLML